MGVNGDSSNSDFGKYRVRLENEFITFTSPMYDYSSWNGNSWLTATNTGDQTHIGPSWLNDETNICCEVSNGAWTNCSLASNNIGVGLWSQGNANQHLRCGTDTTVQNGLILFVR